MRSILAGLVVALLALSAAPAAHANCTTPCTKAQITTDISTNWPDNTTGQITPALLRSTVSDLLNSYLDINGSSSFTCPSHQWMNSIASLTSYTCTQPAASDLSNGTTGSGSVVLNSAPAISGGTADSMVIGGTTPAAGTFSVLKVSTSYIAQMTACVTGVNFNSANTDTAISIPLPTGISLYTISRVQIHNASASISTATAGVFTATGGGGQTVAATQALTVTATAANTNNNTMILTLTNQNTMAYNSASLQFRTTVAQGSAATADVCINYLASL